MKEKILRKQLKGTVISDKMQKTRVVAVNRLVSDALYGKTIKSRKKYHIDDPNNESHIGDYIEFRECRPLSKLKRWRLQKIITKAVI